MRCCDVSLVSRSGTLQLGCALVGVPCAAAGGCQRASTTNAAITMRARAADRSKRPGVMEPPTDSGGELPMLDGYGVSYAPRRRWVTAAAHRWVAPPRPAGGETLLRGVPTWPARTSGVDVL